ncbi:TetR/AcrR family transcriptional regulator [Haliangium sp.]|uniref:TetR/AcrR family transcriptional regulator n=1 Tax=Haliangium sp. TaxID=2663208 RepID=UPI003D1091D1
MTDGNRDGQAKQDRRIQRSQLALKTALLELTVEKGFDTLSVAEIAERANVGRSTFYAHYADKDDLLQDSVNGLGEHLRDYVEASDPSAAPGVHPALRFCLPMLEHVQEQRLLFLAMAGRRSSELIQELFHDMWADLVRAGWPDADEVAVQTIAGGFNATMFWWRTSAPELSPLEVFERFSRFVTPGLPAVPSALPRPSGDATGGV